MTSKHRSRSAQGRVIALSVSYQREPLLARGLGIEHLRELVLRLARPIIRSGASIGYGGGWKDADDNFTYLFLRLISAEQEDHSIGGSGSSSGSSYLIGGLLNYSPWPHYLQIARRDEAQWINCCRIVRITQELAGIPAEHHVRDLETEIASDRYLLNGAITRSAMRRIAMAGTRLAPPDAPSEAIPPVAARIVLGGKLDGFHGFAPGVLEEALVTLERGRPLYLLGGFGGIAEVMARAFLAAGAGPRPEELTAAYHERRTPVVTRLRALRAQRPLPAGLRTTEELLDALWARARGGVDTLDTGLSAAETRELLVTRDMDRAVRLVREGLRNKLGIALDPA